ncbi:MAG: hypothetical protein R2759_19575 [Bacteroidales bacterium]
MDQVSIRRRVAFLENSGFASYSFFDRKFTFAIEVDEEIDENKMFLPLSMLAAQDKMQWNMGLSIWMEMER